METLKRPSCGVRRSVISSPEITLMREITCSASSQPVHVADGNQDAVDAIFDDHAARRRFEVDIAGLRLQRIVNRRMHEFDDDTGFLADGLERQLLHRLVLIDEGTFDVILHASIAFSDFS